MRIQSKETIECCNINNMSNFINIRIYLVYKANVQMDPLKVTITVAYGHPMLSEALECIAYSKSRG